jgi:S-adenosylmethionine uptake transporter
MTAHLHPHLHKALPAIILTCLGYLSFSIGDTLTKILSADFKTAQIFFVTGVLNVMLVLVIGTHHQGRRAFQTQKWKLQLFRAFCGGISGACSIYAVAHISLAEFYTLIFTAPFWFVILSAIFLKEAITKNRLIAMFIGFSCVLYMFLPGQGLTISLGAMATLLGAFMYAASMTTIRYLGPHESKYLMFLLPNALGILCALPFVTTGFVMPNLDQASLFLCASVFGGFVGFMLIVKGLERASAPSLVAPFHYTQLIYGVILGYVIFDDVPTVNMMIGAFIIAMTGLYLTVSETVKKNKATQKVNAY